VNDRDIERVREREFPLTERVTYLDFATFGPLPTSHVRAASEALAAEAAKGSAGLGGTALLESVREEAAALLHSPARNVCLLTSTSEGMGLVAAGLPWRAGDEVIVPEQEFEGCVAPFLSLGDVTVRVARAVAEIPDLVGERTRAVALSLVDRIGGARAPVEAIAAACREHDTWLALDAAQAMGVLDLDAPALGADVVCAHGYKFLVSGFGLAPTYCSDRALAELRVPRPGWKNAGVGHGSAARFEPTMSSIPVLAGMRESLRLLNSLDAVERERRALDTARGIAQGLAARGFQVREQRSSLVSAPHPDAETLATRLHERGIVAAAVEGNLRLSTHFFTTDSDVQALLDAL